MFNQHGWKQFQGWSNRLRESIPTVVAIKFNGTSVTITRYTRESAFTWDRLYSVDMYFMSDEHWAGRYVTWTTAIRKNPTTNRRHGAAGGDDVMIAVRYLFSCYRDRQRNGPERDGRRSAGGRKKKEKKNAGSGGGGGGGGKALGRANTRLTATTASRLNEWGRIGGPRTRHTDRGRPAGPRIARTHRRASLLAAAATAIDDEAAPTRLGVLPQSRVYNTIWYNN